MVSMRAIRRLLPALLFAFASPVSATDNLGDLVRAYVAAHTTAGHLPSYARQTGLAMSGGLVGVITLTAVVLKF
jgi:hypothetical protein